MAGSRSRRARELGLTAGDTAASSLDAGAVLAVDRGLRAMIARLQVAQRAGLELRGSAMVVAQVWRDRRGRQVSLARLLLAVDVRAVNPNNSRDAGALLNYAGTADAIDGTVGSCYPEAAETLLRWVYSYRDGGSAWDAFPEQWRQIARENGRSVVADLKSSMGGYPRGQDLATITAPVVCTYGSRSRSYMRPLTRSLAQAIPAATVREIDGAAHAVAFDAPGSLAQVIVEAMRSSEVSSGT